MNKNWRIGLAALCLVPTLSWADCGCLDCHAAQSSASKIALATIQAERPQTNNPIVRAVRGPQCVDQYSTFGQIMQLLEQMPLGGTGDQILQTIMQLFGGAQNSCSLDNATNAVPGSGTAPTMSVITSAPLAPTPYGNGGGSSTSLYQSLFP